VSSACSPLKLERFALIGADGGFHEKAEMAGARTLNYGCGRLELLKEI